MLGWGRVRYSLVSMNVANKIQSDVVEQWQTLTQPPKEAAGEADGKEQPDLVKALLDSRQETALQ